MRAPSNQRAEKSKSLIICGASGSGKSTIIEELKQMELDNWAFPQRLLTRKAREDDNPSENISIGVKQFKDLQSKGKLHFWWRKTIAGRDELYGFRKYTPRKCNVYSGNDAILSSVERIRKKVEDVEDIIVVRIELPEELRTRRLGARDSTNTLSIREVRDRTKQTQLDPKQEDLIDVGMNDRSPTLAAEELVSYVLKLQP